MYSMPIQLRWSDMDPNFHLRHSVYYDFGAMCRLQFLIDRGLGPEVMIAEKTGVILFREEAVFRKEIVYGDKVSIDMALLKARADFSRWSIVHRITRGDEQLAVEITVDGAWINTERRKLAPPPDIAASVFAQMPRSDHFSWIN